MAGKAAPAQQSIAERGRLVGREHGQPGTIRLDNLRTERGLSRKSPRTSTFGADSIFVLLLGKCVLVYWARSIVFFSWACRYIPLGNQPSEPVHSSACELQRGCIRALTLRGAIVVEGGGCEKSCGRGCRVWAKQASARETT